MPCMPGSTPASPRSVGAETTREGPCVGHTSLCAAPPAASSCSSAGLYGTKLEHLRQSMVGDSEHLLQLFEQYKLHKQKLLEAAHCSNGNGNTAGSSSSSGSNQHPEGCTPAAQGSSSTLGMQGKSPLQDPACTQKQSSKLAERSRGASAAPCVGLHPSSSPQDPSSPWCPVAPDELSMQAQQQILQLEACLLKFMLSLQEALDEARHHHKQQQQHSSSSSTLGSARTSPSRLERPGTAMSSSSSRCTDATGLSSRSSSLGGQLLSAMRREKQQLAQELRRMQGLARAPRGGAAAVFPWQRTVGNTGPALLVGSNTSSSTGVSSSSSQCWTAAASGVHCVREGHPGDAGTAEGVVGVPGPEPQADCRSWEEVDEVLQLLAGCQLDQPTSLRHTGSTQAGDTTAPVGSTGTRPGASHCRANRQHYSGQAAAAASGRAPARSTSLGHGAHLTSPPRLMKSISCGVPRCGVQPQERGIGSLKARR